MLMIIIEALKETTLMLLISGIFTLVLGIPLGFLLYGTNHKNFFHNQLTHYLLQGPSSFINSMPYLVVMVACLPITKWLMAHGVSGSIAAVIPLTIAAVPLYGLLTYKAICKLPSELSDTAKSLGATPWQALFSMYLPEILPNLIHGFTTTMESLIRYSTISGIFGAGGLGFLLIQKGYYDFSLLYITICALLLAVLFQTTRYIGILVTDYTIRN